MPPGIPFYRTEKFANDNALSLANPAIHHNSNLDGPMSLGLKKSEFDFLSHRNPRGPPALATATHGPTGIVPSRHAGGESPLRRAMHWNRCWRVLLSNFELPTSHFSAATHPRRSCFAFAGRDSLRSVGHDTDAATFSCWRLFLAVY